MNTARVHFVGIGGIGMSALAQLYVHNGAAVTGTDRAPSPVTELLQNKGVDVVIGHSAAAIPKNTNLVICSDAVPEDNPERQYAHAHNIPLQSYYEALGMATRHGVSIVIAGTHGKTTTTAMLAKVLIDAGKQPTVIAGSILSEYGSNFVPGSPDLFLIEGCEYRRHFLQLHPHILVVTNLELDHTDYYTDLGDVQDAFKELAHKVPKEGTVIANTDLASLHAVLPHVRAKKVPYQKVTVPPLRVPSVFNIQNAQAAKAAMYALDPDVHEKDIDMSLSSFSGTWRRFEAKGVTRNGAAVYDDYAHHPTEVAGTLAMAHELFPDKKVVLVFHPHLYSRTKSFFSEFVDALSTADESFILPIYAAREARDDSVSSEALVEALRQRGAKSTFVLDFDDAQKKLASYGTESVILTMGAGDVYHVADEICAQ